MALAPTSSRSSGSGVAVQTYVAYTGAVTISGANSAAANTIVTAAAFTADGTTLYAVEFYAPTISPFNTSAAVLLELWEASTSLGVIGYYGSMSKDAAYIRVYVTPAAGSRTYSVRGWQSGGNGSVTGGTGGGGLQVAGYIRVVSGA
jgi:uridine phosphorylase